jgi:hypothetical protein
VGHGPLDGADTRLTLLALEGRLTLLDLEGRLTLLDLEGRLTLLDLEGRLMLSRNGGGGWHKQEGNLND